MSPEPSTSPLGQSVSDPMRGVCGDGMCWQTPLCEVIDEHIAQRDSLADAIEDYLLWEPGRAGHAAAHRALVASLRKVRP